MDTEHKMILARRLEERREEMGISTQEVADRAGTSRTAYSNLINSHTDNPRVDSLFSIARVLGMSFRELTVLCGFERMIAPDAPQEVDLLVERLMRLPEKEREKAIERWRGTIELIEWQNRAEV